MNCPECGKPNSDGNRFCIYCGAELKAPANHNGITDAKKFAKKTVSLTKEKGIPAAKEATKKAMPVLKKYRIAIICVVAVVLAVSLFFGICSSLSKPERVVEKYFNAMIDGDYEKAYKYLNVGENEFITKENFVAYVKSSNIDYSNISDFEVENIEDYNDEYEDKKNLFEDHGGFNYDKKDDENKSESLLKDFRKNFRVVCVTTSSESDDVFEISAYKQEKKFLLMFPSYKVAAKDLIGNYSILAPEGFTVKVDGIKLHGKPSGDEDQKGLIYSTGSIFRGEHELTLENPLIETYKSTFYLGSGDSDDEVHSVSSLRINPTVKKQVFDLSKELITKLINGAVSGKPFESLKVECVNNPDNMDSINDSYENFADRLKNDDGTGLQKITFTKIEDESEQKEISTEAYYTCRISYDYKYVRTYEDYWDDEIETTDGESDSSSTFTFKFENGKWLLNRIDRLYINY